MNFRSWTEGDGLDVKIDGEIVVTRPLCPIPLPEYPPGLCFAISAS